MRTHTPALLIACALSACAVIAGCNIVAGAYLIAHGPEKTPKVATLPKEQTAVIAIDDRASVVPQRSLRDVIGKTAEEEILAQKLVKDMVASRIASAVMARERASSPMGVAEIGQAVKADVVIYVVMERFGLSEDGTTMTPFASARVKLVDSATGTRLSPPEGGELEYHPLTVRLPPQTATNQSTANQLGQLQDLARVTGIYLARMFYDAEKITAPNELKDGR